MGVLTESYNLAMSQYRQLMSYQDSVKTFENELNKINETSKINNQKPVNKTESTSDKSFQEVLSNTTSNITSDEVYSIGGYGITIPSLSSARVQDTIKANEIDKIVSMASNKYNVPEALIYKVIETESNFNTNAVSYVGATGLMQIMPFNNKSLGITDATDPYQNIMGGTKLLSQYLNMYDGDIKLGLAAYNAGPGNVNKYGGVPPFAETQNYIRKILGVEP